MFFLQLFSDRLHSFKPHSETPAELKVSWNSLLESVVKVLQPEKVHKSAKCHPTQQICCALHHAVCNWNGRHLKDIDTEHSSKWFCLVEIKPRLRISQIQMNRIGNIIIAMIWRQFLDVIKKPHCLYQKDENASARNAVQSSWCAYRYR